MDSLVSIESWLFQTVNSNTEICNETISKFCH